MLTFGEAEIVRVIDSATLRRGRRVHAKGNVLKAELDADGTIITGRVQGSQKRPYQQKITLRPGKTGTLIHGTCSCPVHTNCKHVAAVLLEVAGRQLIQAQTTNTVDDLLASANEDALSNNIKLWIERLDETIDRQISSKEYPEKVNNRIIYVLKIEPARGGGAPKAHIAPMVARLNKNGTFGKNVREFTLSLILSYSAHSRPKYLRPIDIDILHEMHLVMQHMRHGGGSRLPLDSHSQIVPLLSKILATDRCHFDRVGGPVLSQGAEITAAFKWVRDGAAPGRQRLAIAPRQETSQDEIAGFDAVLPTAPPCYIRTQQGLLGALDLGLPLTLAARLAEAPEVSLSEAAQLSALLDKRFAKSGVMEHVPLPETPQKTEKREVEPIPRLELYLGQVRFKEPYSWYVKDAQWRGVFNFPLARLSFDYDGEIVQCDAKSEFLERLDEDMLILTPRDTAIERNALKQLSKAGLQPMEDCPLIAVGEKGNPLHLAFDDEETGNSDEFFEAFGDPNQFIAFSSHIVPKLIADGWQISYSDDYPYQIAEGETDWWANVDEGSGIDWFSFELGIEFEGERISLAPHLASLLAQLPAEFKDLMRSDNPRDIEKLHELGNALNVHHKLSDGRLLPLPANRLMPMLKALLELIGPRTDALEGGKVQLHRAEAGALVEATGLLGQNLELTANAERLIKLGKDLQRGHSLKEIAPPASFGAELRPYQSIGLSWLDFLRETGFGGVLADDMGLGKTVQTLAFLLREKMEGRLDNKLVLIVAPTSVLPNWQAEAERFAPDLKVLMLRGPDRKRLFGEIANHDLVLTTYPLLLRDAEVLLEHEYHAAVLDEAQAIKNPKASLAKHAHAIKADHRFALTGTPLENNLGEVWSLFQFLSPGLLGDETTFRRTFRTPIEKHGCQIAQSFLTRRLKPFMLRRTKQEVAKELPPKTEIIEHVRLEGAQRDLYETVRVLMHDKVRDQIAKKGLAKSHIVFLDALLKLRQICCDPRLLKMPQARKVKQSAKLERLMQMLPEMVSEGRRILLFSQFTKMLALIEAELTALNIPYVILTGDTQDRVAPVKAFQAGKAPVFLLSLKAGGTGLNLTAADTVIHYDPWWNPAVEAQATDRAYRIGQTRNVFVYKFMVEEGIEEAIELLKARKAALAEALFAGASKSGLDLTEADISALFAPLQREPTRKAA